ncbi:hypothetical protein LguiB_031660 [Lonicera macranthoides]
MNLVVAHPPMFMIPLGLSPSDLLDLPGFFSLVQEIPDLNLIEELGFYGIEGEEDGMSWHFLMS